MMEGKRTGLQAVGVWFATNVSLNLIAGLAGWILTGQFTQLSDILPFLVAVGFALLWKIDNDFYFFEDSFVNVPGMLLVVCCGLSLFFLGVNVQGLVNPEHLHDITEVLRLVAQQQGGLAEVRYQIWGCIDVFATTPFWNLFFLYTAAFPLIDLAKQIKEAFESKGRDLKETGSMGNGDGDGDTAPGEE